MLFLPLLNARYFTPDWNAPDVGKSRYIRPYGWVAGAHRFVDAQQLLTEQLEWAYRQLRVAVPMEAQVIDALKDGELEAAMLERVVASQSDIVKPNCTLKTALKRLEKQGRITKRMIAQGWYRRYVYSLAEGER